MIKLEADFDELKRLKLDFPKILKFDNGLKFLKLRSMSRKNLLQDFCQKYDLNPTGTKTNQLFQFIFEQNLSSDEIDVFISEKFLEELKKKNEYKEFLYTQLYKLKNLDWGGLHQNALEQNIVNNYVKKIMDFDILNEKINIELQSSLVGYVHSSWYNNWTSILIEDMFKQHSTILPAIGKVKNIDFFWNDVPLDLKVTFLPSGYVDMIRKEKNLKTEFNELKSFAKKHKIRYDTRASSKEIFNELLNKISESQLLELKRFYKRFKGVRKKIIDETVAGPKKLAIWLYENQGFRRFDATNRFYLILIDSNNLEQSWKLKRNRDILPQKIKEFLDKNSQDEIISLEFDWEGSTYKTQCFVLFVII